MRVQPVREWRYRRHFVSPWQLPLVHLDGFVELVVYTLEFPGGIVVHHNIGIHPMALDHPVSVGCVAAFFGHVQKTAVHIRQRAAEQNTDKVFERREARFRCKSALYDDHKCHKREPRQGKHVVTILVTKLYLCECV